MIPNLILSGFATIVALIMVVPPSHQRDQSIQLATYELFTTIMAGAL
jgi:hypothetical protein